jgi:hypothetical protein
MKTKVVNVKVKYLRPKYQNLKEWMKDKNNVYIGRKKVVFINGKRFPPKNSIWANPYKIDEEHSRDDVIKLYKKYIKRKIKKENLFDELMKLKGKNLGCWCQPEKCHGDVLIYLIKKYSK